MFYDKKLGARASEVRRTSVWGREKPITPDASSKISKAKAARLNVTSRELDEESLSQAALSFFAGSDLKIGKLARQVRTSSKGRASSLEAAHSFQADLATLPVAHLQHAHVLPPQSYDGPVSTEGYAARLQSRNADEAIVSVLERELSVSHEAHGGALRDLRIVSPKIYDLLIRGYPRAALEAALAAGEETVAVVRPIVVEHVIHLGIATGHLRIAEPKNSDKNPLVTGWAGNAEWPTMRQVSLAALVEPAKPIHQLLELSLGRDMTDTEALELAKNRGLLEDDRSSEQLIAMAKSIQKRLPEHNLIRTNMAHIVRGALRLTKPVKSLKIADFNDAGWSRRTFAEERFGVRASEGAVIVAMNLAALRERAELCIEAVLERQTLPQFDANPGRDGLSNNSLARLTEALRVEGKSDKSAPKAPGDPENHNGKKLVQNVRKKIARGEVGDALTRLHIDPAAFFRRLKEEAKGSLLTP